MNTGDDINQLNLLSLKEIKAELKRREQKEKEERKAYKEMVEETIEDIVVSLQKISDFLSVEKLKVFGNLKYLLDLKREVYDVKDTQQSYTFSDEKGHRIIYGFRTLDDWDDTVEAGIEKVETVLDNLAKDENSAKLVKTVKKLLKKDVKGNLKANRVLELMQMADDFEDTNFKDGVEIIRKSYKPVKSRFFIEAYYTDKQGVKRSVPLSMSSVDFPLNTNADELFPVSDVYLT